MMDKILLGKFISKVEFRTRLSIGNVNEDMSIKLELPK